MLDLVLIAVVAMLARNYIELSVLFGSAMEYISALGPQTDKTIELLHSRSIWATLLGR